MKKLLYILFTLALIQPLSGQNKCCPDFEFFSNILSCNERERDPKREDAGEKDNRNKDRIMFGCRDATQTFYIYPGMDGFNFDWHISGGELAEPTNGSEANIVWGNGYNGKITVFISSQDSLCRDSITTYVQLLESPIADFDFTPTGTICLNQNIFFTNLSQGGTDYYWDFGDGTGSTDAQPAHSYSAPGTYTVTLTVYNKSNNNAAGDSTNSDGKFPQPDCGCFDIISKTITISAEEGLSIETDCKEMLCFGDAVTYFTPNQCESYNWSVTGGTISGPANQSSIDVIWDGSYPATITLQGDCGSACGDSITIQVPVLFPNMSVTGKDKVCSHETTMYHLPVMPGTSYSWSVTGSGNSIIGPNFNTASVNVKWGAAIGSYELKCEYHNPHTGCSGEAIINVDIVPEFTIYGQTQYCVESNFTINATGDAEWSISPTNGFTPATFANGISISGVWDTAGTYTITATTTQPGQYCNLTAEMEVVVVDKPTLNPIEGPDTICPGSSYIYKVSSDIDDGYFSWTIPSGGQIASYMGSRSDSVMVQWNNTGPYRLTVEQWVNGCSSPYEEIIAVPYPAPQIIGSANACMDNIETYTASISAPPGGYTWSLSNALGTIVDGQGTDTLSVMWHGSNAGNTATLTLTTCSGSDQLNITISAPPQLTILDDENSFCSSTGRTLTASVAGAQSYSWTRNDQPFGGNTQSVNITLAGKYSVEVVDTNGCVVRATVIIDKEDLGITATLSTTDKTIWECDENINVTMHASPGTGYCYQWYRVVGPGLYSPISGATGPTYTATAKGSYFCEISDCGTDCVAYTQILTIIQLSCDEINPCEIDVDFTHTDCNPITFTASSSSAAAISSVHWIFGDGNEAMGNNYTHQFTDTATYKVCALVTDVNGCTGYVCKDVKVNIAAYFKATANCDQVTLTNLSKSRDPITSYNWSFPGGTPATYSGENPPVITYANGGLHTISLSISDGTCTLEYQDTIRTFGGDISMTIPTPLCVNTEAPFDVSTSESDLSFHWDFGDGYYSNLKQTTHAYQNTGTYTVTLTATGPNGCSKTVTQQVTVDPQPVVDIGADQTICVGESATLTASQTNFTLYQWYKDGIAIPGANDASYNASSAGSYYVIAGDGPGCLSTSNSVLLTYHNTLTTEIFMSSKTVCTGSLPTFASTLYHQNAQFQWSVNGPASATLSTANQNYTMIDIPSKTPGNYEVIVTVTDQTTGCVTADTICLIVNETPTITIEGPTGELCEGEVYTFVAKASPDVSPLEYTYFWSTGHVGDTLRTAKPGLVAVTAMSPGGCPVSAVAAIIKPLPDVRLFPAGCDTLCVSDTIWFPLPQPVSGGYIINWYDDDGTAITPVGNGYTLPLSNLHPGIHHLYATVSYPGGCEKITQTYHLYVEDCTLPELCEPCEDILETAKIEIVNNLSDANGYSVQNFNLTIEIKEPVQEVRLSLSDFSWQWSNSNCDDCDLSAIERGCLFPTSGNANIGPLQWVDWSNNGTARQSEVNSCPQELVWKGDSPLMPGIYTIPFELTIPKADNGDCEVIPENVCFHLTLIDTECQTCETVLCADGIVPYDPPIDDPEDPENPEDPEDPNDPIEEPEDDCDCNLAEEWNNLYMIPQKPGAARPNQQILCNTIIEGFEVNVSYVLSGIYYCLGECASVKNEIIVYNRLGQIIYSRESTTLNETIVFPEADLYTITLTAHCGEKTCVCTFKVNVGNVEVPDDGIDTPDDQPDDGGIVLPPDLPDKIDKIINATIPKDFNGGILVAVNDSILYERYVSHKHEVNSKTSFDIASITKTFTAAAVLKLMEEGKIDINLPVSSYLPSFPFENITVRLLLTHRSGLIDYLQLMDRIRWDRNVQMTNKDLLELIAKHKDKVQINRPDVEYRYSNTNYALLALIIEAVTGNTYANYLDTRFFMPLEMKDTYVLDVNNFAKATRSYYRNGSEYQLRYLDLIYGDKCVYSSPQDLRKWDSGLRAGKVLDKATLENSYKTIGSTVLFNSTYVMGWKKVTASNGKEFLYHDGWWAGNRALLIRLPDENVVIAVLSNNNFTTIKEIRKLIDLFGDYGITGRRIQNF